MTPGRAHAVALLNAAATVTRVQSLPGFVSATFMTSAEDDYVFEIVEWESGGALSAVREDHRYRDHIDVLHDHAETRFLGMSPLVVADAPFTMTRGDRFTVCLSDVPDATAEAVASSLRASAQTGVLSHVAATTEGVTVTALSVDEGGRSLLGRERWRREFSVIEAVTGEESAVGRPVLYRLLRSAAPSDAAHA